MSSIGSGNAVSVSIAPNFYLAVTPEGFLITEDIEIPDTATKATTSNNIAGEQESSGRPEKPKFKPTIMKSIEVDPVHVGFDNSTIETTPIKPPTARPMPSSQDAPPPRKRGRPPKHRLPDSETNITASVGSAASPADASPPAPKRRGRPPKISKPEWATRSVNKPMTAARRSFREKGRGAKQLVLGGPADYGSLRAQSSATMALPFTDSMSVQPQQGMIPAGSHTYHQPHPKFAKGLTGNSSSASQHGVDRDMFIPAGAFTPINAGKNHGFGLSISSATVSGHRGLHRDGYGSGDADGLPRQTHHSCDCESVKRIMRDVFFREAVKDQDVWVVPRAAAAELHRYFGGGAPAPRGDVVISSEKAEIIRNLIF